MSASDLTRETAETTAVAVCQARDCDEEAVHTIASPHGHPDGEWKLCENHYTDCGGRDPYEMEDIGWTLRKLYYRCLECNEEASHNVATGIHSC